MKFGNQLLSAIVHKIHKYKVIIFFNLGISFSCITLLSDI